MRETAQVIMEPTWSPSYGHPNRHTPWCDSDSDVFRAARMADGSVESISQSSDVVALWERRVARIHSRRPTPVCGDMSRYGIGIGVRRDPEHPFWGTSSLFRGLHASYIRESA
jgi:hypothetical protein